MHLLHSSPRTAKRAVKRSLGLMLALTLTAVWLISQYPGWRYYSFLKITFIFVSISFAHVFVIGNLVLLLSYCLL